MKKSSPPPHPPHPDAPPPDATTQIILGDGDDPDGVSLEDHVVRSSASPRVTAPPPLPPMPPMPPVPPMEGFVAPPPSVFPPAPAAKPRYWIYGLVLLAFFGVSVAGAALLVRATSPKIVPAAKASAAPSTQSSVITIQPVDMTGPESTP